MTLNERVQALSRCIEWEKSTFGAGFGIFCEAARIN
jgi:hypothetical protein